MDEQMKKEVETMIIKWLVWFHKDLVDNGQIPTVQYEFGPPTLVVNRRTSDCTPLGNMPQNEPVASPLPRIS